MTEQMNIDGDDPSEKKIDGRTKEARLMRQQEAAAAARTEPKTSARTMARGEYVGRHGEVLKRSEFLGADQFNIPPHLKEDGWDYQWLAEDILGDKQIVRSNNNVMHTNGWRPVAATGRWNGVFFPATYTGHILVGNVGLYERPMEMSTEARNDELRRALVQMQDRDQSLMGNKVGLRDAIQGAGFEMNSRRYRGAGADIRMSIDKGLDIPRPQHLPATE